MGQLDTRDSDRGGFRHDMYRSVSRLPYEPAALRTANLRRHSSTDTFAFAIPGVAYSMAPEWPEPRTLQHWPGKMLNELANKVPTLIEYTDDARYVQAWGFLCDQEREDADTKDFFKLHLDPQYQDERPDAPKLEDARRWFQDYLSCLHNHIEETFSNSFPRWRAQNTEFLFSVPTTWKNPSMIAETERLIKRAGFGGDGPNHRVKIGLTEAEAAAVYASKQQFQVRMSDNGERRAGYWLLTGCGVCRKMM